MVTIYKFIYMEISAHNSGDDKNKNNISEDINNISWLGANRYNFVYVGCRQPIRAVIGFFPQTPTRLGGERKEMKICINFNKSLA